MKEREKLANWWGDQDTSILRNCHNSHDFAKLFVSRFKNELGYGSAVAWPIMSKGDGGRIMFYMVHASDHPEAHKLMWRAYRQATNAAQPMEHLQAELEGFALPEWRGEEQVK